MPLVESRTPSCWRIWRTGWCATRSHRASSMSPNRYGTTMGRSNGQPCGTSGWPPGRPLRTPQAHRQCPRRLSGRRGAHNDARPSSGLDSQATHGWRSGCRVWWCARGTAVTGQGQALICAPVSVVVRSGCPARCSTWHVLTAPCASSRGALARAARSQEVGGPTCA